MNGYHLGFYCLVDLLICIIMVIQNENNIKYKCSSCDQLPCANAFVTIQIMKKGVNDVKYLSRIGVPGKDMYRSTHII